MFTPAPGRFAPAGSAGSAALIERQVALQAASRVAAPAQTISTGKGAMRRVRGGRRPAPAKRAEASLRPAADGAAAPKLTPPRGALLPPSLSRTLHRREPERLAVDLGTKTPQSGPSGTTSGMHSSFAWVSPSARDDWSVVDGDDSSSIVEFDETALDPTEVERRIVEARNRLPRSTLLGHPACAVRVGDLEHWLDRLLAREQIGAEAYDELYTQMASAPQESDVGLAMRSVGRCIERAHVRNGLPSLARSFLQVAGAAEADEVFAALLAARGQLADGVTSAEVAGYLVGCHAGAEAAQAADRRSVSKRRAKLEAHWRRQPAGAWTLPAR